MCCTIALDKVFDYFMTTFWRLLKTSMLGSILPWLITIIIEKNNMDFWCSVHTNLLCFQDVTSSHCSSKGPQFVYLVFNWEELEACVLPLFHQIYIFFLSIITVVLMYYVETNKNAVCFISLGLFFILIVVHVYDLILSCRQRKVKSLSKKQLFQGPVPKLAEKKTWMHLVEEIMIMAMNLMTLCKVDLDNEIMDTEKCEPHAGCWYC